MPVVRIIAGHPVHYSLNNGYIMSEFDHGEYYDVPPHVARGMLERGWAELASPPGQPGQPHQPHPQPPPQQQPQHPDSPPPKKQPEKPKDDEPVDEPSPKKKAR